MMPVCRKDLDLHACGTRDIEGFDKVLVNSMPVHHLKCKHSHGGIQIQGSPNVVCGPKKRPIARSTDLSGKPLGDLCSGHVKPPYHPPSPEVKGSPDVIAN